MSKTAKKKLEKALKNTKNTPDSWFGSEIASAEDLPSIKDKKNKVRKNIFIDEDTADYIEDLSKKHGVGFTSIANDILSSFVENEIRNKNSAEG